MVIRLGYDHRGTALEFLSNSRGRRNARAHRQAQTSQLSYLAKIMLFFSSAISNI